MLDQALATTDVTTVMTPYASAEFSRRIPEPAAGHSEGARNFAFLGQFVELPEDVVFTVEYSVHCAMHAVYALFGVDNANPADLSRPRRTRKSGCRRSRQPTSRVMRRHPDFYPADRPGHDAPLLST